MTDEPLTNFGRTANVSHSHRRAVERRDAAVAAAVAAERARLREAVLDYQIRKGSEYVGHPDAIFAAVLALLEDQH